MAQSDCCFNCMYAWRDLGQALITLSFGFPARPQCVNQPDRYGLPTTTLIGKVCPNCRARPPEPGADAKRIILTNGMVALSERRGPRTEAARRRTHDEGRRFGPAPGPQATRHGP